MTLFDENNVSAESVFASADQLRNEVSQPQNQEAQNTEEQRVPYERFKEVNEERKRLQDMVEKFMQLQANPQAAPAPVTQAPAPQQNRTLFTDDELDSFETDIVVNPKETLRKFGDAILHRGVEARTKELEDTFTQKLNAIQQQMVANTIPTVIDNFVRTNFDAGMADEAAVFKDFLNRVPQETLTSQEALQNIRLAAIGQVALQRRQQQNTQQSALFSEAPGSGRPGGFGGLSGNTQTTNVPREAIEAGKRMGLSEIETASMYRAMNNSGVFR